MLSLVLALAIPARIDEALDKSIEEFRVANRVVGMTVCVMREGKVAYEKGFGLRDREANEATKTSDLYRLGSVSKSLAAIAAVSLAREGKLDLDADARPLIPEISPEFPVITMRQILSHRAGIRHYQGLGDATAASYTRYATAADAMKLFAKDKPIHEPGSKYSYSTHGYTYAARVMESVEQKPFDIILRERTLRFAKGPVDVEWSDKKKAARTQLYVLPANGNATLATKREDNSWKFAGGGMEATAYGLASLGAALIDGRIVDKEGVKTLWTPPAADGDYALGFTVAKDGTASHNGAQQGCRAAWRLDPSKREVVVVLCNTSGSINVGELATRISASVK